MYQCPDCSSPRKDEVLVKGKSGDRRITIKYEAGCVLKLRSDGKSWHLVNKKCGQGINMVEHDVRTLAT